MRISEFDYDLPDDLIAQQPLARRDASRMMFVDRKTGAWKDDHFSNFPEYLCPDDTLVINNTKVFPARLLGTKTTGAKIELFLIREIESQAWEALARPMRRLKVGDRIGFSDRLGATIIEKTDEGRCIVSFEADGDFEEILDSVGKTPLPPYIKRNTWGDVRGAEGDIRESESDRRRYQTTYARTRGAIAAPTAGLHFTTEILNKIRDRGVQLVEITLHVGYGTFEPVRVEDLADHTVAPEFYEINSESATALNQAKQKGSRIIAVGTTATRALESSFENDEILPGKKQAELTITPGYEFKVVDGLLTNFHLPKSSLLVLVSTFAGHEEIMFVYKHAVESRYRFYSYGDCMLIL